MRLNRQKGNMYGFVTHTGNVLKGKCGYDCVYCYMKRWKDLGELRFDETELDVKMGGDEKVIFVGSGCDMWHPDVTDDQILRVLDHCCSFYKHVYLFQSKNPARFLDFKDQFPPRTILGTTIESDRLLSEISNAPSVSERVEAMWMLEQNTSFPILVSVEPVLACDSYGDMLHLLSMCKPDVLSFGGFTGRLNFMAEPPADRLGNLIERAADEIDCFVHVKPNLKRLLPVEFDMEFYNIDPVKIFYSLNRYWD